MGTGIVNLRRMMISNRHTMSDASTLGNNEYVFFCGTQQAAANDDQEKFFFGRLDSGLTNPLINYYSAIEFDSTQLQKGGDCALTIDNGYFVGGFSTKLARSEPTPRTDPKGYVDCDVDGLCPEKVNENNG